jgi:hypothetical protein
VETALDLIQASREHLGRVGFALEGLGLPQNVLLELADLDEEPGAKGSWAAAAWEPKARLKAKRTAGTIRNLYMRDLRAASRVRG